MRINFRLRRLSLEEQLRLATDYNSGMPVAQIMEKYKVAYRTVYRVLHRVMEGGEKLVDEEERKNRGDN